MKRASTLSFRNIVVLAIAALLLGGIVRGVLIMLAIILTCVFTLALWQFYPRTAFGSTMRPVAYVPVMMNGKVLLSTCTTDMEAC